MSRKTAIRVRNVGLILVGVSLPVITGLIGPEDKNFDFASAAVVATAVATLALAYLTATLASVTRDDASGTRKIADLTERDINERNTGIVIVVRVDYDPASVVARVHLKNVGQGPAVFITTVVELRTLEHKTLVAGTSANDYALASEEEVDVDVQLVASPGLTGNPLVEEMLAYGTFLGRGDSALHFLWRRDDEGRVFGLWGSRATAERMEGIIGRPDWATLRL